MVPAAPSDGGAAAQAAAPDGVEPRGNAAFDLAPPVAHDTPQWPSFRGARTAGVADSATPVVAWDLQTGANVRWSTPLPGYSHASPVIWGDTVFVVTAVSENPDADRRSPSAGNDAVDDLAAREWRIYALRRDDGHIVWQQTAHRGRPRVSRHEKGSHANSTPATDGRHVVAVFNSEGLYCWSMDGELLWSRDLGRLDPGYWGQPDNNWGHASSPVLFEDTVIVQSDDFADSFLAALRLADGEEVWRVARDELATWSTPLVHGEGENAVIVTQGGNNIRAYRARTGAELWSYADHAEVKVPSPIAARGLFILSGGAPAGRHILALAAPSSAPAATASGAESPPLRWTIRSGGPYTPTPVAYEDLLYVARDNGVLSTYGLADGELVYRQRLGTGFSASPVAADGRIYLASEDGDVFVVRAGREFEQLSRNAMHEPLFATPALSRDLLVVRGHSHVYGLAADRRADAGGAPAGPARR